MLPPTQKGRGYPPRRSPGAPRGRSEKATTRRLEGRSSSASSSRRTPSWWHLFFSWNGNVNGIERGIGIKVLLRLRSASRSIINIIRSARKNPRNAMPTSDAHRRFLCDYAMPASLTLRRWAIFWPSRRGHDGEHCSQDSPYAPTRGQ